MPSGAAYFFGDAHLGAEPPERERSREARLVDFLDSLHGRASSVVVIGDLFDFWFEYRTAIPRRHFRVLRALQGLVESGVPVTYLNGNHDFWLGRFLAEEIGVRTHEGALSLELQGRRVWVHHGDGLLGGDLGYKVLRQVLRHPASIALYGLLHPDLAIPLAHRVSAWSRGSREGRALQGDRLWREIAEPRFALGYDAVLIGHLHQLYERREGGREFFVLGDWLTRFSYAVLEGGKLRLEVWPEKQAAGALRVV